MEPRNSGGNHTIVFNFTNNVVSGSAMVTGGVGDVTGSPVFSGNTMTVDLTGVANAQALTLQVNDVTDEFGEVLPTTSLMAGFLVGDTTGNGTVNVSDIGQVKGQSGQMVGATNFREDLTVDGNINVSDVGLGKSRSGQSIP